MISADRKLCATISRSSRSSFAMAPMRGSGRSRSIRFLRAFDPRTLLDAGFSLDGTSATFSVDPCTAVFDVGEHGEFANDDIRAIGQFDSVDPPDWAAEWSLTKPVNNVQERIVAWPESLGCEVKFG